MTKPDDLQGEVTSDQRKKEPGLADILQAQAGTKYCSPSSEDFLRFEASGVEAACPSSPPACLGRLTPLARPDLPLSQEQGNTDTEIVAATRFAALHSSLFRPILENQSGQPILMPNNPRKRCFFVWDRSVFIARSKSCVGD